MRSAGQVAIDDYPNIGEGNHEVEVTLSQRPEKKKRTKAQRKWEGTAETDGWGNATQSTGRTCQDEKERRVAAQPNGHFCREGTQEGQRRYEYKLLGFDRC